MDNKKWYKKLNTVFWWTLSALPLVSILLCFFSIINLYNNDVIMQNLLDAEGSFYSYFELANIGSFLDNNIIYDIIHYGSLPFLYDAFADLFNIFFDGVDVAALYIIDIITAYLAWFVSVHIYHLIVDVLVWLPNMLHKLMDKYQD